MAWVSVHGMSICSRCCPLLLGYHTVLTLPVGSTGITIQNKNGYCHMSKYTYIHINDGILVKYRMIVKFLVLTYLIYFISLYSCCCGVTGYT